MKKLLAVGVAGLLALGLAACSEESTSKDVGKVEAEKTKTTEPVKKAPKPEPKEVNQVIADNANVKATLKSIVTKKDEIMGDSVEVTFEVQNKRKAPITVQGDQVSADGKMIDSGWLTMSTDIAAGKVGDAVLIIQDYEGGTLPVITKDFEMLLNIFDTDTMEWSEEHKVKAAIK